MSPRLDFKNSPSAAGNPIPSAPAKRSLWRSTSSAWWAWAGSMAGFASFAAALGFQHFMGLQPCPLCIFQRVAVLASSAALAASALASGWRPRWGYAMFGLCAALALAGLGMAAKHMHVMWFPQDVSCGPDLEYLLENFTLTKWLPQVFAGEAECSAAAKQLVLGLPIPVWSALLFLFQALASARAAWISRRP